MKKFIFFALIIFSLLLAGLETEATTLPDTTPRTQCQFFGNIIGFIDSSGSLKDSWSWERSYHKSFQKIKLHINEILPTDEAKNESCDSYKGKDYIGWFWPSEIKQYPTGDLKEGTKITEMFLLGKLSSWSSVNDEIQLTDLYFINSIEDAVRATGGTYSLIDTSNPESVENFINRVFEQGLTDIDQRRNRRNCWDGSIVLKPGENISCSLGHSFDAYYRYQGQKGEKITVTVSAQNFIPEIVIIDANEQKTDVYLNDQGQNSLTITKILPYTGEYKFEVIRDRRYLEQTKGNKSFTIRLTSDKTNVQPDIREDNLIPGKKYSIRELNSNQSKTARVFLTDAFVVNIYEPPYCPPGALCKPILLLPPNITICDNHDEKYWSKSENCATLWLGNNNYAFKIKKKYQFEVKVENTSNTNIPRNVFNLVSVKNLNDNTEGSATVDNQKISFLTKLTNTFKKILNWFTSLFK